jgi:hypothetical protein
MEKIKRIFKLLINPFTYIGGTKALLAGIAVIVVASALCIISGTHLDGVIDYHPKTFQVTFWRYLLENVVNAVSLSAVFFIIGSAFSKSSIRFIDVAGNLTLARYPYLLAPVLGIMAPDPERLIDALTGKPISSAVLSAADIAQFAVFGVLSLLLLIWIITVYYYAFSVSCNIKKGKGILLFSAGIILAEIASKALIGAGYQLIK